MIYIIIIFLGFILDRVSKNYAVAHFIDNPIYTKILNFTYLENKGAAFGFLQNKRIFFVILTVAVVGLLLFYFFKTFKNNSKLLNFSLSLIISGALGNFYERILQGYVVDFIEFSFVNFPVFNIADCFVTVGSILLIIYVIFFDKEDEKNDSKNR